MKFAELGLVEAIQRAVQAEKYDIPTPIQTQAIPHVLKGRDLLGCAQTGTGKTAAFALPTLQRLLPENHEPTEAAPAAPAPRHAHSGAPRHHVRSGSGPIRRPSRAIRCLVLAPTRELAAQIGESFETYGRFTGLRQTVVYGGVGQGPQVHALRQGVDVLVATPGRLLDLMHQGHIDLSSVQVLILDEADQMLDMGFLPALERIVAEVPRRRQTLLFSATMPPPIRRLADQWLREPIEVRVVPAATPAELVTQSVFLVETHEKSRLLAHFLHRTGNTRTLVFTRTKHGADKVVKHLERNGIRAAAIHGNKSQNVRQRVLAQFRSEQPPVLVATDVAARGLDIDAVSHVINFDIPVVPELYVHRIGRTGRAGAEGIAISFCGREERGLLKQIERLTRRTIEVQKYDLPAAQAPAPTAPAARAEQPASRPAAKEHHRPAAETGNERSPRHPAGPPRRPFARKARPGRRERFASRSQ